MYMGGAKRKKCLRTYAKIEDSEPLKDHLGVCSPFIHSVVSSDSVSGQ